MAKTKRNLGKIKGRTAHAPSLKANHEQGAATQPAPVSQPVRNPSLLAVSAFLFAGWFIYLLIIALRG